MRSPPGHQVVGCRVTPVSQVPIQLPVGRLFMHVKVLFVSALGKRLLAG